jgi:anaerobic selenocysteine-containing dehydrogenase
MPEKEKKGLTRRSFLKTTAVVAGSAALAGGFGCSSIDEGLRGSSAASEELFSCVCRPNCFAYCHINVHVRDGNIVKTSMAPYENPQINRICMRGLSHPLRTYDPERVKYPLRRVEGTERGAGAWERITWDEAIAEVAEKFMAIQKEHGEQALAFSTVSGNMGLLNCSLGLGGLLANVLNVTSIGPSVDAANTVGVNRVAGNAGLWVGSEPSTWIHSKTIFAWSNNLTDAQIHDWHFVADAQEKGTKLIVIDPIFTQLAAKADKWVPIRPASDAALTLSMMYVILEEKLENVDFLQKHTVAPFLVNSKTGKFIRMSDLGTPAQQGPGDTTTGELAVIDPPVVWDEATKDYAAADEAVNPALSGNREINGTTCHTAFDLLKDEINKYPPETAAQITEVPADTIRELARIAADGPVTHRLGYGNQAYDNGVHPSHAGMTLCALLGNIGKPGANYGANWNVCPGINFMHIMPTGPSTSSTISTLAFREVMRSGKFKGKDYPVKAVLHYVGNPLCTAVHTNELKHDVYDKLDFIVTVDFALTDTARYSDIVLPASEWFETPEILAVGQTHYVQYSEKAIDPLYESKSDANIFRLIANKMGVGEFFQHTDDEWLAESIDTDYCKMFGITFETLKQKKAMRYFPDPWIAWEGNVFLTPSGRMEFYLEDPQPDADVGQTFDVERERLPRFFPPTEAWHENPLYQQYPLVLMSERPRFRVHGQWFNTKWLRELDPEPTVKINPEDARVRGIEDGGHVECYNDRGHCVAKAVYNVAIRPGTLVYPKSWQAHQHKAGSWSELASSAFDPVAVNQSFMDNLCEIRVWKGDE